MSLPALLNQPCTFTIPTASGEADRAGVPADDVATVTGFGYFEQKQATDQTGVQSSDEQRWLAMVLPTGTTGDDTSGDVVDLAEVLNARATVEPEGLGVFQLVGEPWPVRNPRTRQVAHLEFEMRKVTSGE